MKNVLVIDSNTSSFELIRFVLGREGYQVFSLDPTTQKFNGSQALSAIIIDRAHPLFHENLVQHLGLHQHTQPKIIAMSANHGLIPYDDHFVDETLYMPFTIRELVKSLPDAPTSATA